MSEQDVWTMVNKIAGLIEERDSLGERVAFLVAEAHGWQPRLEAALARVTELEAALTFYRDADAVELACDEGNTARAALAPTNKEDTDE